MICLKRALTVGLAFLPWVVTTPQARAEFFIAANSVTVPSGGTGTMNFSITSNNSDTLSAFGLELLITPTPSATSLLQYAANQPNPYANPDYVFLGQSFGSDFGLPFWALPSDTHYMNDTITGGDSSDSNQGYVTIPPSSGVALTYLASIQFSVPMGATSGDTFNISLVPDPNFTYFDDLNGNPVDYQFGGSTVTVSAVPEPSSLLLLLLGGGPLLCSARRTLAKTKAA